MMNLAWNKNLKNKKLKIINKEKNKKLKDGLMKVRLMKMNFKWF